MVLLGAGLPMKLFQPVQIGTLLVPNRIAKSAMVEGRADKAGRATQALAEVYERWSLGGVGLMIMGMAHVLPDWSLTNTELGLDDDALIAPLRQVTAAAHRGPGKIIVQLCHAAPQVLRAKAKRLGSVAPSAGFNKTNLLFNRSIRETEIHAVVSAFGAAARRAREAGADGVQIHAAHGYLLSRFLSPRHNRRRDAWGGSVERRSSILKCIAEAVRAEAGHDFPLLIKLNAHDGEPGGLTLSESVSIAQQLEAWGYHAIEVSAGTADVGLGFYPNKGGMPLDLGKQFLSQEIPVLRPVIGLLDPVLRQVAKSVRLEKEAYFLEEAKAISEAVNLPVLAVGGIRSRATAERIVTETRVAMVSLARPLVRDPELVQRWKSGALERVGCQDCNRCFVRVGLGEQLRCESRGGL